MHSNARFHYIDNMRGLALLLGVVFHAALAHGPYFHNLWISVDPDKNVFFNYLAMWTHLFRMPLFFIIAGFCAALLMQKRGGKAYIQNRLKRLLIPFIIFLPLTLLVLLHAMHWGSSVASTPPPLFGVMQQIKEPQVTSMHLWFLWYLSQFCVLFWLLHKFPKFYQHILDTVVKPVFLCVILPVIITASMSNLMVPFPAPDKLQPHWWAYGFYGSLFLLGAGLFHHHEAVTRYSKRFNWLLMIACTSLVAYFYFLPPSPSLEKVIIAVKTGDATPEKINLISVVVQTIAILSWTAVAYLAGFKWLSRFNKQSRYISDASYWIYLIHIPLLVYIQLPLTNLETPVFIKFTIALSLTVTIGIISYHYLVRNTVIGILLNGRKAKPKNEKAGMLTERS
ncbi:acyltransferase family protein [Pseudoalteromonas piscicida]|uniref:acyltransferase family protein n=1 Tax=Pseudoalteromonas piscicida TaxID=43662 RepID=UPI001C9390F3|nr:acyltransferase family protein [Pseudoalteromonas piscicida]QZO13742.1 acyltransferase family protein [Pseudoalteromonas piscicida]